MFKWIMRTILKFRSWLKPDKFFDKNHSAITIQKCWSLCTRKIPTRQSCCSYFIANIVRSCFFFFFLIFRIKNQSFCVSNFVVMKEKAAMLFLGFLGRAVLMMTVISIFGCNRVKGHRVLLDTDMGTDDIFALLYLLKLSPSQIDLQVCFHFTLLYISP